MQYILVSNNKAVLLTKYCNRNNKVKPFLYGPKQSKNQTNIYILTFFFFYKTNSGTFSLWEISGVLKVVLKIAARLPYKIKNQVYLN